MHLVQEFEAEMQALKLHTAHVSPAEGEGFGTYAMTIALPVHDLG